MNKKNRYIKIYLFSYLILKNDFNYLKNFNFNTIFHQLYMVLRE